MKKSVLFLMCFLCSCRSITYQDVNPVIQPNANLLPAMESIVDVSNLEATYTVSSYAGTANNFGTTLGNTNWAQTTAISGVSYKDPRVQDVINVFNKEVKENITSPYGAKKGYIVLTLGYRGVDQSFIYPFVSLFSLGTINFFGFPGDEVKQSLEVEVEIRNNNKELVKRYVENVIDTQYVAMYWGYSKDNVWRKVAADNIKQALQKIRDRINSDAAEIKKKLK